MLFGRRASTTNGLTWGFFGGWFGGAQINNGTITLAASSTNYIYANSSTGVVSSNTTGFPGSGAIPLYVAVTGASTVNNYTDERNVYGGSSGGGSGTVTSVGAAGGVETDQTSGAAITGSGNVRSTLKLAGGAIQTAAYTFVTGDRGACLVMNDASAVSQPLPTPTGTSGSFPAGWWGSTQNIGAGTMTLTVPTGESLDGVTNGTLALAQNAGVKFFTDGSNWFTVRGSATGGGGMTNPMTTTGDMITGGTSGTPQRLGIGSSGQVLGISSGAPAWVSQPYDMAMFAPGVLANSQKLTRVNMARAVTFPSGLTGSYATAGVAATASTTFTITRNGTSIGSINFAASATTGTFTFSSAVTTAAGDIIQVTGPSTADATLADVSITLVGTR